MARKRRRKGPSRPAPGPAPPQRQAAEGPSPFTPPPPPPAPTPRWDPSLDVRLFAAYLVALVSLVPFGAAGFIEAATTASVAVGLGAVCLLGAAGWRRRWGWRRPETKPADRTRSWITLGAGAAALLVAGRLVPPSTAPRMALYFVVGASILFAFLLLSKRAAWSDREFRRACRRLLRASPRPADTLPRWKRIVRMAFYVYAALSWAIGLAYFYAFGAAMQGGAPAAEGTRTERLQMGERVAYVTPREARMVGILGEATTFNLPGVVALGLMLQVGLRVPIVGMPRVPRRY